jgi:hypothetical protein
MIGLPHGLSLSLSWLIVSWCGSSFTLIPSVWRRVRSRSCDDIARDNNRLTLPHSQRPTHIRCHTRRYGPDSLKTLTDRPWRGTGMRRSHTYTSAHWSWHTRVECAYCSRCILCGRRLREIFVRCTHSRSNTPYARRYNDGDDGVSSRSDVRPHASWYMDSPGGMVQLHSRRVPMVGLSLLLLPCRARMRASIFIIHFMSPSRSNAYDVGCASYPTLNVCTIGRASRRNITAMSPFALSSTLGGAVAINGALNVLYSHCTPLAWCMPAFSPGSVVCATCRICRRSPSPPRNPVPYSYSRAFITGCDDDEFDNSNVRTNYNEQSRNGRRSNELAMPMRIDSRTSSVRCGGSRCAVIFNSGSDSVDVGTIIAPHSTTRGRGMTRASSRVHYRYGINIGVRV